MKYLKKVFILVLFISFGPKVSALSYDINTLGDISVDKGSKIEINVSIDNIKDTTDGISVCSMKILFDKNILLESSIRTLGSWTMTRGDMYLFDTGTPVLSNSNMFTIPVVVNGEGTIQLSDILCSDGVEEVDVSNKKINFHIKEKENASNENSVNNQNNNKPDDNNVEKASNCNLSNIELSEGNIEFDPNVTEYEIEITDFDNLEVTPKLEDNSSSYVIDKNHAENGGNIVIIVTGSDGGSKVYTIYTNIKGSNNIIEEPKKKNYIPMFIGIITVLLLVNVIRIIKNSKKK